MELVGDPGLWGWIRHMAEDNMTVQVIVMVIFGLFPPFLSGLALTHSGNNIWDEHSSSPLY